MSHSNKDLVYNSQIRDVKAAQMSVISPEELINRSVVHVKETILYDSSGEPIVGGLFDPRMGVIDHGKICPTDGLDNRFCPGYFGHIELAKPVYHVQFLDIAINVHKCICTKCSKLRVNIEDPIIKSNLESLENKKKMSYILELSAKSKNCEGCGSILPAKIQKDPKRLCKIFAEWKDKDAEMSDASIDERRINLTPEMTLKIFKRITD